MPPFPPRAAVAVVLLAVCVAAPGASGCAGRTRAAPAASLRAPDEAAIRGALDSMVRAWNGADLAAHVAPYLDSAAFMTGNGPLRGRERTAASLARAFWRDGRPTQTLRFERVALQALGNGHALVTGRFVLDGGGAAERSGWYTLVWVRTPDGWRILHDHSG
jgi:ketosteroid isomerase-like protein